jgi:hypothetical protein
VREQLRDQDSVMFDLKAVRERLAQLIFERNRALAISASSSGFVTPDSNASRIARADFE